LSCSQHASPSGSQLSSEDKAALWDGLMACDRIRVLGYARGGSDGQRGPINHIGLELWATFTPAASVELNAGDQARRQPSPEASVGGKVDR